MKYFFKCFAFFLLISCGPKKIKFERPVDTSSRPIEFQNKTSYDFPRKEINFNNKFDGARINGVSQINDTIFKIIIKPENTPINNSAYYSFEVSSQSTQTIYLQFDYPQGYSHRYIPKQNWGDGWKITENKDLGLLDDKTLLRLENIYGNGLISAQEIQNSNDVKNWINKILKNKSYINLLTIGETNLGRPIWVLDITKGSPKDKPLLLFFTRQHPPEVTGYFAFKSFVEELINNNPVAELFLNKYRVLAFPLVNPDGVDLGHWRHNAGGIDTNRDWGHYRQPEIRSIVNFIKKTKKKYNNKIVMGLDFHSTYYDVFYTNVERESTPYPKFLDQWFEGMEKNIPDYKVNEKASNSTQPVSKGWLLYANKAIGVTYEIGDETSREKIDLIGKTSAQVLMKLLTDY